MASVVDVPPDFLKLLSHDVRWRLVMALAASDRRVQELVTLLRRPQNLISYHLRLLREGQVVRERRSSADRRDVYYSLDLEHLRDLYLDSGQALHPALTYAGKTNAELLQTGEAMTKAGSKIDRPHRVLFLCTHNSARSQLAEGILRASGSGLAEAYSAGSESSQVHPLAVRAGAALDIDIGRQRSKHMDEFAGQSFDYVITVCDKVREVCPAFPDDPHQIHWSFPDPAAVEGSEELRYQAFKQTARELQTRIGYLLLMIERSQGR